MKYLKIKYALLIAILVLHYQFAYQQTKVNVLTKKVEKEFTYNLTKDKIIINAEKANISVKNWGNKNVRINLNLITKNSDIDLAREELSYLKYTMDKTGKEIRIKNYILLESNIEKLQSIVQVNYEVCIPDSVKISIHNKFGNILFENINASVEMFVEYCDIKLSNVSGSLNAEINIGELECKNTNLNAKINTRYSEVFFENNIGNYLLNSNYGSITIFPSDEVSELDINSISTEIILINKNCMEMNLTLEAIYATISISENCYLKDLKYLQKNNTGFQFKNKNELIYYISDNYPSINISSRFGNLKMN